MCRESRLLGRQASSHFSSFSSAESDRVYDCSEHPVKFLLATRLFFFVSFAWVPTCVVACCCVFRSVTRDSGSLAENPAKVDALRHRPAYELRAYVNQYICKLFFCAFFLPARLRRRARHFFFYYYFISLSLLIILRLQNIHY